MLEAHWSLCPVSRRADPSTTGSAGRRACTGIDALIWRVGFLLLTTVGVGALAYCVLWILMAEKEKHH